jgi:predicted transcriptional regulator of viral defense system
MRTNHNSGLKTTRSRMANLLMALYDSGRTMFTTAEAAQITSLTLPLTSSLLHKARKRGLVSGLKRGLFVIVPPELEALSNTPEILPGCALLGRRRSLPFHAVCHGTSPHGDTAAVCHIRFEHQTHSRNAARNTIPFCSAEVKDFSATQNTGSQNKESVEISDLERTVLDGLRHPEHCGGITDAEKASDASRRC